MPIAQQMVAAAQALSPDQVARLKNQQYVATLKAPPQWKAGTTPYGVNRALAQPNAADALKPDPRFSQPGPNAEMRPQPKPEDI